MDSNNSSGNDADAGNSCSINNDVEVCVETAAEPSTATAPSNVDMTAEQPEAQNQQRQQQQQQDNSNMRNRATVSDKKTPDDSKASTANGVTPTLTKRIPYLAIEPILCKYVEFWFGRRPNERKRSNGGSSNGNTSSASAASAGGVSRQTQVRNDGDRSNGETPLIEASRTDDEASVFMLLYWNTWLQNRNQHVGQKQRDEQEQQTAAQHCQLLESSTTTSATTPPQEYNRVNINATVLCPRTGMNISAMHVAARRGCASVCKLLLDNGAESNNFNEQQEEQREQEDQKPKTKHSQRGTGSEEESKESEEEEEESDDDSREMIQAPDVYAEHSTPLDLATEWGHRKVAKLLLKKATVTTVQVALRVAAESDAKWFVQRYIKHLLPYKDIRHDVKSTFGFVCVDLASNVYDQLGDHFQYMNNYDENGANGINGIESQGNVAAGGSNSSNDDNDNEEEDENDDTDTDLGIFIDDDVDELLGPASDDVGGIGCGISGSGASSNSSSLSLSDDGHNINNPNTRRCWRTKMIELLLKKGDADYLEPTGGIDYDWGCHSFEDPAARNDAHYDMNLLNVATVNCLESILLILLDEKKMDVNTPNSSGWTPLHFAVDGVRRADQRPEQSKRMVHLLLDRGANVNAKNKYGLTPFHFAVEWANETNEDNDKYNEPFHLPIVELLLRHGADINAVSNVGQTPLLFAAQSVINSPRRHGNNGGGVNGMRNRRDRSRGRTGRSAGAASNDTAGSGGENGNNLYESSIVKLLLQEGADVLARNAQGETPLLCAVSSRSSLETVKLLIDAGADIHTRNNTGTTPLIQAISSNRFGDALDDDEDEDDDDEDLDDEFEDEKEEDEDLDDSDVEEGVVQHRSNARGRTNNSNNTSRLTLLTDGTTESIIMLLLDEGADVNAADSAGCTALHEATKTEQEQIVRLLLERCRNIRLDHRNRDGLTPLHLAAAEGHDDIVRVLLEYGADFTVQENHGRTPYQLALENEEDSTAQVLRHFQDIASASASQNEIDTNQGSSTSNKRRRVE